MKADRFYKVVFGDLSVREVTMEEFDGELRIGDDNDPPGMKRHFKGSIKNVQIYDYSLSSSEIETVFQEP
jgi:hypothetical protein